MNTVRGIVLELWCNHDNEICPLQNITCRCVAEGVKQTFVWKMQSQPIAQFDFNGKLIKSPSGFDIVANALSQEDKISSNLSFIVELKDDTMTVQCFDDGENSKSSSYAVIFTYK